MTGITSVMLKAWDDPAGVFRDLLSIAGGRDIVSDALDYDGMWMKARAMAARRMRPAARRK